MPSKSPSRKPTLSDVLDVLEGLHGRPMRTERTEDPLLDHFLVGVLGIRCGEAKAREAVRAVSEVFLDFNEARVSPLFELADVLKPFVPEGQSRLAAWDVRMALQDVYDGTHGLDLEPLRDRDPDDQRNFLKDLVNTPGGPAAAVFQIALGDDRLALGPRERHLLTRLGMLPRAANVPRIRAAMEKLVPPAERLRFAWVTGAASHQMEVGDLDATHPFVKLLVAVKAKELAEREKQRKREELRRIAEEKKKAIEEAKRLKQEEVLRKKREADAEKKALQQKRDEAKKAAEAARKEKEREKQKAKAAAAKKSAAAAAAAAKKKPKKAPPPKKAPVPKKAGAKKPK